MIRFNQDELDGLVETLRDQPGFITAAVVPAGSGDALIEGLRAELEDLKLEVAAPRERAIDLGAKAAQLGRSRDDRVFILRLDDPGLFDSAEESVQFWRELNYQREALGSGTVRTCLILSEESERGLALIADDLWDWTTIFRFPDAIRPSVRTPADSESLIWSDQDDTARPSEDDLTILRSQWQRARQARLPPATFVQSYAVPLFLALPESHDAEAIQVWEHDLRRGEALDRLPPDTSLLVARKMMCLARVRDSESRRGDLVQGALGATDGAVAILERKAAANPQAFQPGLAAALSASAKIHQDAGRFEVALSQIEGCLDLLRQLAETGDGAEAILKTHIQRRWALLFLLRARVGRGLTLLEQVESLLALQDRSLDNDLRSNALGSALEISITRDEEPVAQVNAGLFTAWLLSHDYHLEGPSFEQVLAHDPVAYCMGLEALWQLTRRTPWEQSLVEPLIREWSTEGPASPSIYEQLVGWLLHFCNDQASVGAGSRDQEERLRAWGDLQWIAIKVLGYRYETELVPSFCRYLASLSGLGEDHRYWRHRAALHLGFMLRWSYQERTVQLLAEVASAPESSIAEVGAAKDLANELQQTELPDTLRHESRPETTERGESFYDQLRRGQRGLLRRFPPEEFCERAPRWGIAALAGDPDVPELSREDHLALVGLLKALIKTGRVRDDSRFQTPEDLIFDAWIPWLARGSARDWWAITSELIERQIDLQEPQRSLVLFPVLGIWSKGRNLAEKIEERLVAAMDPEVKRSRENSGVREFLRWALHLEDAEALLRCLEALTKEEKHADVFKSFSIIRVLEWTLDRATFEAAGERRRAASKDTERRLWFLVEWSFVGRLPPENALAWCKEVAPLTTQSWDLGRMLIDQLLEIDDCGALEVLLGEEGITHPGDEETQNKIISHASRRHVLDHLENRYPRFVEGLTLGNQGTLLSESGRTAELRQWGHDLFSKIRAMRLHEVPTGGHLVFTWNRRALHRWAHLEPEAFLAAAEKIFSSADALSPALLEAILIVWQDLDPLAAAEARAARDAVSRIGQAWSQRHVPVYVHTLWDAEFSALPEHRTLRLRWLRSCRSDKDIALQALAARTNSMLTEVEILGKELLSSPRQLERALGVSLLAWHPKGDQWLEPLLASDPSTWVRHHARWAITVCRRDRLGRQLYRDALSAASWLEQQARLEQLVPLIMPTFPLWPVWGQEIAELTKTLSARRKALLVDFWHHPKTKAQWKRIVGRDLEKFCRGENISTHLAVGEKGPPWLRLPRFA